MCEVLLGQGAEINATDKVSSRHKSGSEPIGAVKLLWFGEKLWLLPAGDSPTSCVNWVQNVGVWKLLQYMVGCQQQQTNC